MRVGVVNMYTIGAPSQSRKRALCLTEHILQAAYSFRVTHGAERADHPRVHRLHRQTLLHLIRWLNYAPRFISLSISCTLSLSLSQVIILCLYFNSPNPNKLCLKFNNANKHAARIECSKVVFILVALQVSIECMVDCVGSLQDDMADMQVEFPHPSRAS